MSSIIKKVVLVLLVAVLAGCASGPTLPVTPNVNRNGAGSKYLQELPPEKHVPDMQIFYITDREQSAVSHRGAEYGYGRGNKVSYGLANVSMPDNPTWDELVTHAGDKGKEYSMVVNKIEELGEFIPTADRMVVEDGHLIMKDVEAQHREEAKAKAILEKALDATPQKDVYIFIHGFNNSLDGAVMRLAGIWHHLGRRGVPVAYTWPAGRGGVFGYFYDRESGEFTIYDLKRTLKILASCPKLERMHIIAHSRGTDVAITALRELNLEYQAAGKDPQKELKLQTVILASPDLDVDVFMQRFVSERAFEVTNQFVVYSSPEDSAIKFAKILFRSERRLGRIEKGQIRPAGQKLLTEYPRVQLVLCEVSGFATSHAYEFGNPSALSDMILILRDHKFIGTESGRPMEFDQGLWMLNDGYPNKK
jgi:esterase/lipase superfamily enzyme